MKKRAAGLSLLLALLVPLAHAGQARSDAALEGWWVAEARHAGQTTPVYLRFAPGGDKPRVFVSLPVLDAWDVPIGGFKLADRRIEFPGLAWKLEVDDAIRSLSGVLPSELVPVHQIQVNFRKTAAPAIPKPASWSGHPRPRVSWSREVGAPAWAGLALDEETRLLLVGTDAGSVLALDARGGAHRWTLATGGKVRATPSIAGRFVYVPSDDGHLYKVDKRNGRIAWKARIEAGNVPRVPAGEPKSRFDRYSSSALERDGRVYVGARDGSVHALEAASGRPIWRFATGDLVMATPTVRGDLVLVGSFDRHVYALDALTGTVKWKRDMQGVVPADIVVVDGRALVGTRAYEFAALDIRTGEPLWSEYVWFSWIESVPVVRKGVAYVGSSDALRLFAFDVGSGTRNWARPIPGYGWSRPAIAGDLVVIGTVGQGGGVAPRDGAVVAVHCKDGAVRWLHPASKPEGARDWGFASSVVTLPGRNGRTTVFAADVHGRVFALESPSPAPDQPLKQTSAWW